MASSLAAQGGLAALSLLAVLALILGAARLLRTMPALGLAPAAPGTGHAEPAPLRVAGTVALDRTRRLHLVDAAGRRALVLTGAAGDVMIDLGQTP